MKENPLLTPPFATAKTLRRASDRWLAAPFIHGVGSPSVPARMLSMENIYEGWALTTVHQVAKQLIPRNSVLTLRDLQEQIISMGMKEKIDHPYVWWVLNRAPKRRVIYEDAAGLCFVKLGAIWQLAYPLHVIRGLTGNPEGPYEDVPSNGYFVIWENEHIAKKHAG